MSPFDEINVSTPRSEEVCQRFARRMDPWWGFVIAALLYAVIAMMVVSLAILTLTEWFGFAEHSGGAQIINTVVFLAGATASWRLFRRWKRRRIADKLELVRNGRLVEVLVNKQGLHWSGTRRFSNVVQFTGAGFTLECGFSPLFSCGKDERIWLLHDPGIVAIVAFDHLGAMHNGLVLKEGSASRGQPRGADLRVDLHLSFAEAVWGTSKDVRVTREVASSTSGGSNPGARTHRETSTLNVTVPPGVEEGQTLRLHGKGEAAPGGTTGNLYVVLHVQPDHRFERNDADVVTGVRITSHTATYGGEVNVPTLDDHCNGTATIAIKPGTKSDEVIVRRGKGIPRIAEPGKRGDHLLRIKVELTSSN